MEKRKFEYSTKNIPLPSERSYKLQPAYRKNKNGNQMNEMYSNFSRHQKRKKQPVKVWIMQF